MMRLLEMRIRKLPVIQRFPGLDGRQHPPYFHTPRPRQPNWPLPVSSGAGQVLLAAILFVKRRSTNVIKASKSRGGETRGRAGREIEPRQRAARKTVVNDEMGIKTRLAAPCPSGTQQAKPPSQSLSGKQDRRLECSGCARGSLRCCRKNSQVRA